MTTIFPAKKVINLRKRAQAAVRISETEMDGWIKSPVDPMKLLEVFKSLNIKDGYTLRGYLLCAGSNGEGIVWALPINSDFPGPEECVLTSAPGNYGPKPPGAIEDFRTVIEGDETPWSYLCASLFTREAWEFGALWHGCDWSSHEIVRADPWEQGINIKLRDFDPDPTLWSWQVETPEIWAPHAKVSGDVIEVHMITYSGLVQEALYYHLDRYKLGTYVFEEELTVMAFGQGGYIY